MITEYFYDAQLRSYLQQFCAIFYGLQVKTGKGEDGTETFISVPTHVGNRDRVVAAIMQSNTHNKPFSLPIMAASITGIDLSPERRKGIGVTDTRVFMPAGGVFPDDLATASRVMPIPYNMNVQLTVYASNTNQLHQIIEQILMLFDPILQIQTTDAPFDWTKITSVELTGIANEENYPVGQDQRILNWSFDFLIPIWISAPMDVRDRLVHKIIVTIGDKSTMLFNEFDSDGELVPFEIVFGQSITQ
ncbi:MAG: tail sheath stabilizer and completion protein [Candidatus Nitrosotenuis sp.]